MENIHQPTYQLRTNATTRTTAAVRENIADRAMAICMISVWTTAVESLQPLRSIAPHYTPFRILHTL